MDFRDESSSLAARTHVTGEGLDPNTTRRQFLQAVGLGGAAIAAGGLSSLVSARPSGASVGRVGSGKTVGISLNVANAYASYVAEGVYQALRSTGYKVRIVDNNADSSTELSNIQNLLSADIVGLVILPVNADTAAKGASLCAQRGVAFGVAQWPTKTTHNDFTAVAWADWTGKGHMMGEYMKSKAKPGNLFVVQGILGQQYSELIDSGLNRALANSGFEIVVRQQGFYDRTKAVNIVQTGLQAYPDTVGIIDYAASMGDGISQYLKSINKSDIVHISSDCDQELVHWLKTPYCNVTAYHSAGQSGLLVAEAVRAKIEKRHPTYLNVMFQAMATGATIDHIAAKTPFDYPAFASKVANI